MEAVEDFIYSAQGDQREIMLLIHQMMMQFPDVTAKIRYKIPFYYRKSWMCYLNPLKEGGVEFAFTRANELSNEHGLLNHKGRKQVAGISFKSVQEIDFPILEMIVQEAMLLDEAIPYPSMRTKRKK